MFQILDTKELAASIKQFTIDAPLVAQGKAWAICYPTHQRRRERIPLQSPTTM